MRPGTRVHPRDERGALGRALAVLLVLALGAGGFAWYDGRLDPWIDRLSDESTAPAGPSAVAPPPGLELPALTAPPAVATPALGAGSVVPAKVRAAIAPYLADAELGPHVLATVVDAATGRVVYRQGTGAAIPASTTKLLTSVAALATVGPETRFATRVVSGGANRIVLVGGGDPFLASGKPDATTPYPERADLETLAVRTVAALRQAGRTRVRLGYDDSLFSGPALNPTWPADYFPDVVSRISSLWVDEGRSPSGYGRVDDPALSAATVFGGLLSRAGITVVGIPEHGVAAAGGREVARVESAPLREIVERVLEVSDNEGAEVLARQVGVTVAGEGSSAAGVAAVRTTLTALGVDLSGVVVHDGSGLSRRNRIPPAALASLLSVVVAGQDPAVAGVASYLPVAGFTGSLTDRFDHGAPLGRGTVRAKTGTLTNVTSLAGLATDVQGHLMVFVLMADRVRKPDEEAARIAMDDAASTLGACSCGRG